MDVIAEENLVENSAARGEQLKSRLTDVAAKYDQIVEVRGLGLMIGNEFNDAQGSPDGATAGAVQQEAAKRGLLLLTCGPSSEVVRFIPALVVSEQQVEDAVGLWEESLAAVLG